MLLYRLGSLSTLVGLSQRASRLDDLEHRDDIGDIDGNRPLTADRPRHANVKGTVVTALGRDPLRLPIAA